MTDIAKTLNPLIQACKDGESGFRHGADHAHGAPLRLLLDRRAAAYAEAVAELQALVSAHGGDATDRGSATAAAQRGWQAVKASVAGSTDASLLDAAEALERDTLEHCAAALQATLPAAARSVVERRQQEALHSQAQLQVLIEQGKK